MTGHAAPVEPAPARRATSSGDAQGRVFFPAFEGLRAVAALLVLVVHTSFASGLTLRSSAGAYLARGEVGVALFFLISGFLLYRPFALAASAGHRPPALGAFFVRRVLRIVPLFWVALTVGALTGGISRVFGFAGWVQMFLFVQVYSKHWVLQGISQAWSLDVEVLFYLLLPLWAAALRRRRRTPEAQLRVELVSLAVVYLVSVAFRWYVLARPSGVTDTWHGWLPTWADLFALGMGLAAISAYQQQTGRSFRWADRRGADVACWAAAVGVYIWFSKGVGLRTDPLYVGPIRTELAGHALYGLFALLVMLPAVFGRADRGPVRWLLTCAPVAFLGLISYGMYVWHQYVVLQLLDHTGWKLFDVSYWQFLPAALAATVALSTLTYYLVERPGIGVGSAWIRRRREQVGLTGHEALHTVGSGS